MENQNYPRTQTENKILEKEEEILVEIKKEEKTLVRMLRNVWIVTGLAVLVIVGGAGSIAYWKITSTRIAVDTAEISAPEIDLAPQNPGVLNALFVHEGDEVPADTAVAQVGNELVKTKVGGVVISIKDNIGKLFNRGETVAIMIDPQALRVEASIQEDKGLSEIHVGQRAVFTVDAFGSKEYGGVVDEISPTSKQSGVIFNISDKRAIKEFIIKIRFDQNLYPELKNGMSAKIWIYK